MAKFLILVEKELKYFGNKSSISIRVPHIEDSPSNFLGKK
ncbi:MAG: hypothetical protein CM1200mP1_07890 [Candidatus Neomarinimicrobiota bacterium]|nr:MAG: hypothetical protein CM1200mP1_07890 [Candidatus Neomarinimicrobiota bacterium]